MISGPITLLILDGFGDGPRNAFDATFTAGMPHLTELRKRYACTQLITSGEAVGLPEGQFGNSEVGHMNLGAGRVVWQELTRIDAAIRRGTFRENVPIARLMAGLRAGRKRLHLLGLVSDGGVHSHQNHLVALAKWAQDEGIPTTIHAFLDGRDTAQKSADGYLQWLAFQLRDCPLVAIGSLCGRYTAMDRDKRWDRTERAWKLLVDGVGEFESQDAASGIADAYARGETDEFVSPTKLAAFHHIAEGDGVLYFNFRADRGRQMCQALVSPEFNGFTQRFRPRISLLTFTQYDILLDPYLSVAYPPQNLTRILGEIISGKDWKQFRTAETEKYAHVTYFFNGGEEAPFPLEDRCLVPSPREVATYDQKPEMSAPKVAEEVISRIRENKYSLIVLNFANLDMVGHTGILDAAINACEVVDQCVGDIYKEIEKVGGTLLVTADHGNSEKMIDENGEPFTSHTMNKVPFILVDDRNKDVRLRKGRLGDIAPTILELMGIDKPSEMTGESLIIKE